MEKLLECLASGRNQRSYDEEVRSFCLTLHFYSARAYNYVRSKFNNNLPAVTTMRNWYASLNASPGFTLEAFEILKQKAERHKSETGEKLLCNLMVDETAIRRHAQWNPSTMKFDGFVDVGDSSSDQCSLLLAKDALVFMVCGANDDFKIPISYFLINGMSGHERAAFSNQILIRLSEIGIEVVAIIFDGLPANITMCRILGADFENGLAHIHDPIDKEKKIYVILDAAHMLKLARNCIGSRNLVDGNGNLIEWKYFVLLYDAQKSLPWNLGNKLSKTHLEWEKRKMSVRLAAETLSNSCADAMLFMKEECELFKNVDATAEYTRIINDIFDIMNSTKAEGGTKYKRAITKSNAQEMFSRFDTATNFLNELTTIEGTSVFSASISTAFFGLKVNMMNFRKIYREYVETDRMVALVTHRFSQDHLETFFGSIRSMGG